MMLVVYTPHLDMVLPTMETDNDEIILSSVPAVSVACGSVSVEGGFLIEARVELSRIPHP